MSKEVFLSDSWLESNKHILLENDRLQNAPELVTVQKGEVDLITNDEALAGVQTIGYSLVTPRSVSLKTDRTSSTVVVRFGAWSEHASRPLDLDRSIATAAATDSIVISIDSPGQSPDSSELTRKQKEAVLAGDFSLVAKSQWDVVLQALKAQGLSMKDVEFVLAGSSQGATLAASALMNAPDEATISTAILWNSPSLTNPNERTLGQLAKAFVFDGPKKDKQYKALNPEWVNGDPIARLIPQLTVRGVGHLAFGKGLVRAADHIRLGDVIYGEGQRSLAGIALHVVHSSEDTVSTDSQNKRAIARAAIGGFGYVKGSRLVETTLQGEYHAITNCIPAVAQVTSEALSRR